MAHKLRRMQRRHQQRRRRVRYLRRQLAKTSTPQERRGLIARIRRINPRARVPKR